MIASSAFVLTALTMTGIYMKSNNEERWDNGYTIDFTALEDNVQDKYQEIAQNGIEEQNLPEDFIPELEDDLDYMPMEVGSGLVELPGLTDNRQENPPGDGLEEEHEPALDHTPIVTDTPVAAKPDLGEPMEEEAAGADVPITADTEVSADAVGIMPETDAGQPKQDESSDQSGQLKQADQDGEAVEGGDTAVRSLHYAESEGLLRPVDGEVLIPYSMDGSIYFTTLAQYKYNSALMLTAREDTPVVACAEGRVISIYENEEIGHAVTMELGDDYQITYGQLKNITVSLNDYVDAGQIFAQVAAPTKYFCVEGSNLYLRMTVNGNPVNPEILFR